MNFFLLLNTNDDIFFPLFVNIPAFFKKIFFCVQQKKEIHHVLEEL